MDFFPGKLVDDFFPGSYIDNSLTGRLIDKSFCADELPLVRGEANDTFVVRPH